MTRFTVIVPVWSAEDFLEECLSSVLGQIDADLEVIAVDDHSPDASGAILDRYAHSDNRLRVIHLTRNHGVGLARNEGLGRARGEYVLFLDADDAFFDRRVLADLDAQLAATGEPDVLLFDYEERRPCGLRRRIGPDRNSAANAAPTFTASTRPAIMLASWVCWNKAYRRDFIAATGLMFSAGYYEDFSWSIPALLGADRIVVAERIGVRYRRCLPSSISRGVNPRQLEVFDQFDRIGAFLDAQPQVASGGVREVLASGARTFLRSRIERLAVIPPDRMQEFRRRSEEVVARLTGRE
jgi:glycosyltransferase involved in cell wall biosynthesis